MHHLLALATLIDRLNRGIGRAATWLVLIAVLLAALTATLRYLADWGSNAMIEAQWLMLGVIFLFCAPWTLQEQAHVRVDILYGHLPPRVRVVVDLVGGLLFLLPFCILMVWDGWAYFLIAYHQNESSSSPGGLWWWPMKLLIPIGFGLLAAQGVAEIIKGIAALRGLRPLPVPGGH